MRLNGRLKRLRGGMRGALGAAIIAAAAAMGAFSPSMAESRSPSEFRAWVAEFRAEALAEGIPADLFDAAFKGVRLNAKVRELDGRQFEFVTSTAKYLERLVSDRRVAAGLEARTRADATLNAIEQRYQVPAEVVAAVWGIESNFGQNRGTFSVIEALATLAFDGRREKFAKTQLLFALNILKAGDVTIDKLVGSWAGAMGHTQFIPSSYETLAVDHDGDGKRNIWSDDPTDALASTANYLSEKGWRPGEPWGLHVQAPTEFDYGRAAAKRRSTDEWSELGVKLADGRDLPKGLPEAELYMPAGYRGPQLLLLPNFRVILKYNNSANYALAVSLLSERLDGRPPRDFRWPQDDRSLSREEVSKLQELLTDLGYDAGGVDGMMGPKSRAAIRKFQASRSMVADGYPSAKLLDLVRRAKAAKDAPILPVISGPAKPEDIREMQVLLTSLGYDTKGVDGLPGRRTREAIARFRQDRGLAESDEPTLELLKTLRAAVRQGG